MIWSKWFLTLLFSPGAVVPVATSVSADETEALKAEITKAVEKVQEAGEKNHFHIYISEAHVAKYSMQMYYWVQKVCTALEQNISLYQQDI